MTRCVMKGGRQDRRSLARQENDQVRNERGKTGQALARVHLKKRETARSRLLYICNDCAPIVQRLFSCSFSTRENLKSVKLGQPISNYK